MTIDRYWSEFVSSMHEAAGQGGRTEDAPTSRITDLGEAVEQLTLLDDRYRSLVAQLPCVPFVAEWDDGMRLRYVAPQVEEMLGCPQDEWLSSSRRWQDCLHPEDRARVLDNAERAWSRGGSTESEYRMIARGGREVWVRERIEIAPPANGRPPRAQGVWLDVTASREAQHELERERERAERYLGLLSAGDEAAERGHVAFYDPVTGLPNRALLEDRVAQAVSRARERGAELALLCVDLDAFKLVNDSLGHAAGDAVLCRIAGRLRKLVGPSDVVARPGGDEFMLLLTELELEAEDAAENASELIAEALQEPFVVEESEFQVGATIGASVFPRDASDADALLKHADAAMYDAKQAGPGAFAVYAGGTLEAFERLSETTRLRRALHREELTLHYQPIFDLAHGRVAGLEALVRWQHPERGLVLPFEFIPLAEETGLIETLGTWVLDAVCRQARAWREAGLDARVSFNVSPRQLRRRGFGRMVEERIAASGADAAALTMEITESTAMQDPDRTVPLLNRLRASGLRLAIDDFGAGYSSLSRLRELPVQVLKIDRSFLLDAPQERGAAGLIGAALALADALEMEAVAEGVETEEQRAFLLDRGCLFAQGFLLSRPVPAEQAESLLPALGAAR